jgi:TetR/AcrR family tetracycline transcriptional repressor
MVTTAAPKADQRAALTRDRIVRAAVRYIDTHGLAGLSMHKLGVELDVKAMSLYKYVANKDDLLDGVVEELWVEIENAAPAMSDWRDGPEARAYARLRTITSYALGTALNDVAWGCGQEGCRPTTVGELLRPDVPQQLAEVAEVFCGQSDPDAHFEIGLGLMLRGIDTQGPGDRSRR